MMYCDYETYVDRGGTMESDAWEIWGSRASRKIDQLTHGRAERCSKAQSSELADACAQIADIIAQADTARRRSLGISSASTDGYSETYADPAQTDQAIERACYSALANALGEDLYGLLYAGVM